MLIYIHDINMLTRKSVRLLREVARGNGLVKRPHAIVRVCTGQPGRLGSAEGLSNETSLVGFNSPERRAYFEATFSFKTSLI